MTDILVKYQNFPALEITLVDHQLSYDYKQLVQRNLKNTAICRDPAQYDEQYFRQLCQRANAELGWSWVHPSYTLDVTTALHKDIEEFLAQGFHNIPEQHDDLLHELHYALHALQGQQVRGDWIQIEWFNDDGIPMPDNFEFVRKIKFGDVKLQNPYVGHDPSFVFRQQDCSNIEQTCKFHDLVRPGLNIMISDLEFQVPGNYLNWFCTHAPGWVDQHGQEKILRYTGWPCVGQVTNLDVLEKISIAPVMKFEYIQVL